MFILLVLSVGVLVALARGGRLAALGDIRLRHIWILFVPLLLQLVAFSPLGSGPGFGGTLARTLYLLSMLLAAVALALNRHLPGVLWIAAGLALNFIVIILNGGFMPVAAWAREFAGQPPLAERDANVIPMTDTTMLPWFSDIIPLPSWMPFTSVFSIGDVLVTIGGIIFLQRALLPRSSLARQSDGVR